MLHELTASLWLAPVTPSRTGKYTDSLHRQSKIFAKDGKRCPPPQPLAVNQANKAPLPIKHKENLLNLSVCIAELLKEPSLSSMTAAALALPVPAAASKDAEMMYKNLPGLIFANDRRNAVASVLVLLRIDGSKWLALMRNEGLFRASRYGFEGDCLKKIVAAALELSVGAPLPPEQAQYLKSVQALLELARPARQIQRSIIDRLKTRKGAALKTLLAIVNSSFSANWRGSDQADENQLLRWSATDLASAFSRLYMISRGDLGIGARTWIWTDDCAASAHEGVYSSLLVDALRINQLIDAEVSIDGLPYMAQATPAGVLVSAIDPEFERSVRLGYIQADLQILVRLTSSRHHLGGDPPKLPSFQEALSMHLEAGLLEWVTVKEEPIERLVIALPDFPPLSKFLNFSGPYLEEFPLFEGALIDNFQPPESADQHVSKHLVIMDLLKAQRVFNLIDTLFCKKLETVDDPLKRRILALRSTVIVTPRADLQRMLQVVMSPEKAQELISLLSLPTTNSTAGTDAYIDLQYKPFVHSLNPKGNYIAIPPAIVGQSNLVRSVMHASGIKRAKAAVDDPMQKAVATALREAGFLVRESFVFNINGERETDIFCYRDAVLIVIECKNAYHPCSPHELRNSFDLVLKGEEQLDIRAQWLAEPSNQIRLFTALSWEVATPARVATCVVTANRAFNGFRCGIHPVRQAHELINVLVRGYVGRAPRTPSYRFWRTEEFEVADLLAYLDGKSVLQTQHAAMQPVTRGITFKDRRLEFAQFMMDLTKMDRLLAESFEEIHDVNAMDSGAELLPLKGDVP